MTKEEALNHPEVQRLATKYPYSPDHVAAVFFMVSGDIQITESLLYPAARPIEASLVMALIETLRETA
jgi:hypothetical protein